jgi:CxxC-x17-CxxC domain-containing protein
MYAAKCANCEIDIEVPFRPDGSRPTFCKECLKDYQRQQARLQQSQEKRGEGTGNRPPKSISLRDAARIPPKPFRRERAERPRKKVNLEEVRSLIKESLEAKK